MFRRKLLAVTALLGLAFAGLSANPAGAAAPAAEAAAEAAPTAQTLVLRSVKNSNLVVDLAGSSARPGTPVITYPYHGGANQQWEVVPVQGDWFQLRNKASGTCLVNGYHSVENGHELTGYGCNSGYEDQLWARVPVENGKEFTLVNKYSGKCMDQTRTPQARTPIIQWTCHGLAHQRFTAQSV
ncbi:MULTISPECIES: RICIN domain-containing protein [Streptomyces]|uniref:RICIN domain-containing protein n=1 Tax=Streptomyces TaxID=1883 RepID=UPI0022499FB6|nr:RICIN domain-containing protein [Streptomyces sp. JHD 1]MCX2968636.1 RICIN domain-containing protein [Streptomyces sp. JHD 1]